MLKVKIESHLSYLGSLEFSVNLAGHLSLTRSIASLSFCYLRPGQGPRLPRSQAKLLGRAGFVILIIGVVLRWTEHMNTARALIYTSSFLCFVCYGVERVKAQEKRADYFQLDTLLFLTHCCFRSFTDHFQNPRFC